MFSSAPSPRFRPLDAARALRALFRDPDDTGQVFKVIAALSGDTRGRMLRRLRKTPTGARLLRERKNLLDALADREGLRKLPEGSLGREYLRFCETHGITADGLVAASREAVLEADTPEGLWLHARMRDAHDLWHVVTGYQTDLVGEASVLSFTVAQTKNPGVALIVLLAFLDVRGPRASARKVLVEAFVRGLRAAWLPSTDWESLLSRPLTEVRRELSVGEPPRYRPVWPHEVFPDKSEKQAAPRAA